MRIGSLGLITMSALSLTGAHLLGAEPAPRQQLRARCEQIVRKLGGVHFVVRLDVAGQYAENLSHFLHTLQGQLANATFATSCGDPQRNKNYRVALFGSKKSDPVEARAAARYALGRCQSIR
jgi:hypothetical protein